MPHRKQKLSSEYSQSFKTYKQLADLEYIENLKFRRARRHQEECHQPFMWYGNDISDYDSNISSDKSVKEDYEHVQVNQSKTRQTTQFQKDCSIYDDSNETNSSFDVSGMADVDRNLPNERTNNRKEKEFTEDLKTNCNEINSCGNDQFLELKSKAIKKASEIQNDFDKSQSNSCRPTDRRPHHPVLSVPIRSKDTPLQRPVSRMRKKFGGSEKSNIRSKFMSYGWGAPSTDDHHKKTFNVKSSVDVYPSAIRAVRQKEKFNDNNKQKSDDSGQRPKTAGPKFVGVGKQCRNSCTDRSVNIKKMDLSWLSEYQYQFPIYDDEVYKRCRANIASRGHSARLDTPRTCRI